MLILKWMKFFGGLLIWAVLFGLFFKHCTHKTDCRVEHCVYSHDYDDDGRSDE
jgi:hypothetical protein